MKKIHLAVFLALAGSGFYTQSAHANLPFNPGDIYLGFYDSAATGGFDYLVDVGSASLYTAPGATFNISATTVGVTGVNGANLSTLFNTDPFGTWYTSGDTVWGAIGGPLSTDNGNTLYSGQNSQTAPANTTNGGQAGALVSITQMENYYNEFGAALNGGSGSAPAGTSQSASNGASWATLSSSGFGYSPLSSTSLIDGQGDGQQLFLYQIVPAGQVGAGSHYEGSFNIDSTGALSYTPASSVPEPSALTALAGGAGLLGLIRRRRTVAA